MRPFIWDTGTAVLSHLKLSCGVPQWWCKASPKLPKVQECAAAYTGWLGVGNRLTNAARDPFAKAPEFKYCAVRVHAGGDAPVQGRYGGGQFLTAAS